MHQSQQSLRYSQIKENNPTQRQSIPKHTKPEKLSIHWENGDKALFYYSYLISVRLKLEGEINVMTLKFMNDTLVLKGYNLDLLFAEFVYQEPQVIKIHFPRYVVLRVVSQPVVFEAMIKNE